MKFLLDMGISIHLVPELRSEGHEAAHIADLSTGTLPDAKILERAREEGYVLLVHDLDFPHLMAASGPSGFGDCVPDGEFLVTKQQHVLEIPTLSLLALLAL